MLKLGIVDFDTSHVVQFTRRLHHVNIDESQWLEGAQVGMGDPGTSRVAADRIPGYVEELKNMGVQIVDRPEDMIGKIDGVLVESNEGGVHLERVRPFLEAGIPAFIDKPFTCSTEHAKKIAELAAKYHVPVFSSSSLRFADEVVAFLEKVPEYGSVVGTDTYSPGSEHFANPGLYHYGIHGLEVLYTLMGPGCQEVQSARTEGVTQVTGIWKDGRVGTVRATRAGASSYGFVAFTQKKVVNSTISTGNIYRELLKRILEMFQTRKAPVDINETIEIVAFVEAALVSSQNGGARTKLATT